MMAIHRIMEGIDIELIESIKLSPCLYDSRHPDFRYACRKDYQWQKVGDNLGMSGSEAKRRWTVLRDRYARELKQVHLNPNSTEFGKNDFFRRMDFLRIFIKRRDRKRLRKSERSVLASKVVKMDSNTMSPFETVDIGLDDEIEELEDSCHEYIEVKQEDFEDGQEVVELIQEYEECGGELQGIQSTCTTNEYDFNFLSSFLRFRDSG